jgi:hypothetical protein
MGSSMQKQLAGLLVCLTAGTIAASKAPEISVDTVNYDLGVIYEGKKDSVMHTFKVKNTGDSVLIIKSVKPG